MFIFGCGECKICASEGISLARLCLYIVRKITGHSKRFFEMQHHKQPR